MRLWTIAEHAGRREREVPEVLRLDLTAAVLELRAWGVGDLRSFPWLDAPGGGALEAAERLLGALGALASDGALTRIGRRMLDLPAPPRLARMLVEAERAGGSRGGRSAQRRSPPSATSCGSVERSPKGARRRGRRDGPTCCCGWTSFIDRTARQRPSIREPSVPSNAPGVSSPDSSIGGAARPAARTRSSARCSRDFRIASYAGARRARLAA